MMTKEEREKNLHIVTRKSFDILADISVAYDALDKLEVRAEKAEAERDSLINGIKSLKPFHSSGVCSLCQHRRICKECGCNKDCDKWTFEYERFANGGEHNG